MSVASVAVWMKDCAECMRLVRAYDVAKTPAADYDAKRALTAHLAFLHADQLPVPRTCAKCSDFRFTLGLNEAYVTPIIRQVLKNAYAEHRASHLITQESDIYRRTS